MAGKPSDEELAQRITELERKVREKTEELARSNELLRHEMEERKQVEASLRERKEALKAILGAPPIGIGFAVDRIIRWGNKALHHMLGYEDGSLAGRNVRVVYPDKDEYERAGWALYEPVKHHGIGQVETTWVRKDGHAIDCYVQVSPLDPEDTSKGVIVCVLDITDRKRAEEHIHALTHELIKAQESERQVISRELHDRVAQDLSYLKIACETLFDNQPPVSTEVKQRVEEISKRLRGTIMAVRDLSYDLRPPGLDQWGLVETISQYCEEFSERSGLLVDFTCGGMDGLRLDFDPEINLYRLVQEGLNNIWKHAEASHSTVSLVVAYPSIILRIMDDGKGFDVEKRLAAVDTEKRMGLRSMDERVRLLGGKMRINSGMRGTKITIKIPLKEIDSESKENHFDR